MLVVIGIGCLLVYFAMQMIYIVLLAPCASALRTMLSTCLSYAHSHGLVFNAAKTQLICFRKSASLHCKRSSIMFNDIQLKFSDNVSHLGHLLSYNLNDKME